MSLDQQIYEDQQQLLRAEYYKKATRLKSSEANGMTLWRTVTDSKGNAVLPQLPNNRSRQHIAEEDAFRKQLWDNFIGDKRPFRGNKSTSPLIGEMQDKALGKGSNKKFLEKVAAETDIANNYWGYRGVLQPEYNILEPYTLLDVESIFLNALKRMRSLCFRNGVEWVGSRPGWVKYIQDRTSQIGYVMNTTFEQHLKDILWNLLICSNCIVVKIRDKENSGGRANDKNSNKTPVAGYTIVPPHTIFPYMDGFGQIAWWRRFYKDGRPYRDYLPEDLIHYRWDVKPGHIYGTPRVYSVRDDIYALRRLEENNELLLIHHLFPLFHIKVGNPEEAVEYFADGSSEVDVIRAAVENMPKEGVFVTDHRVEIDVKGAEGKGIDPQPLIEHYKKRVFTGLGASPIDLGEGDTVNSSTADNISQNMKDRIKDDMSTFGSMVKMNIVKEMFEESGKDGMSVQNAVSDIGLAFHEIDVDGQIKKETHAVNQYTNGTIDLQEARKEARRNPLTKEQEPDMHFNRQTMVLEKFKAKTQKDLAQMSADSAAKTALHSSAMEHGGTRTTHVKKSNSITGVSTSRQVKEPTQHGRKMLSNLVQPENQHGKNLDPHKAKSSEDPKLVQALTDRLMDAQLELETAEELTIDSWSAAADKIIGELVPDNPQLSARLRTAVALAMDGDLLPHLIQASFSLEAN